MNCVPMPLRLVVRVDPETADEILVDPDQADAPTVQDGHFHTSPVFGVPAALEVVSHPVTDDLNRRQFPEGIENAFRATSIIAGTSRS